MKCFVVCLSACRKLLCGLKGFARVEGGAAFSARSGLDLHDSRELGLPLVSVLNQLFLVVQELFVQECRVLVVRSFDNGINRACLLTESAEDALSHIDIVLGGTTRAIRSRL